jgi:hypothetical protein
MSNKMDYEAIEAVHADHCDEKCVYWNLIEDGKRSEQWKDSCYEVVALHCVDMKVFGYDNPPYGPNSLVAPVDYLIKHFS